MEVLSDLMPVWMSFFDRQVFSADMTALPFHVMCTKMSKVFFLGGCLDLFETYLLIARGNTERKEGEVFLTTFWQSACSTLWFTCTGTMNRGKEKTEVFLIIFALTIHSNKYRVFIHTVQVKRFTIWSILIYFTWDGSQTDWSKCLDFYELTLDLYQN